MSTAGLKERAKGVQEQYLVLKKDRSNILLQTKDASQKALEQAKKAKEISGNLDDLSQGITLSGKTTRNSQGSGDRAQRLNIKFKLERTA